jgi:hypothetical protein
LKRTPVTSQKMHEGAGLRPHASFEIPVKSLAAEGGMTDRSSRLAAELDVARRIAADLAQMGYDLSNVGPGSGGGAGFFCRLNRDCEVTVHLGVERGEGDAVQFYLLSWQTSSFLRQVFRGGVKSSPDCNQCWNDLCHTINEILVKSFGSTSVVWRTKEEERNAQHPS